MTVSCRAILFDMDGTLVDSSAVIHRAWRWWSSQHGIPLESIMAVEKGRPNREIIRQFGPHLNVDAEAAGFLKFEENDTEGLDAIAGAVEATQAAQQGLWGIVTSANRSLGEIRLRACGIPIPDVFITADLISRGKPDPECYLLAAHRLNVEPHECLVFEDALAGIAAAQAAGMKAVGVLTSLRSSEIRTPLHIKDFRDLAISGGGEQLFEVSFRSLA